MARRSGQWSAGLIWLVWFTTLCSVFSEDSTPEFVFTQELFNATIPENAPPKTYASPQTQMGMWLKNTNIDIRYKIAKGERGASYFKPEARIVGNFCFLLLRTKTDYSRVLNRERQEYYILNILAKGTYHDGTKVQAHTKVRVRVLDANDLNPIFYEDTYDVTIGEDTAIHTSILTVKASDSDIGENGEVYYQFVKSHNTFAIHPVTGVVTLTRTLNYDEQKYYELFVEAEDRGPKLRSSAFSRKRPAMVRINVKQVNFYDPEIKIKHLETLAEHGIVGTVYAILTVEDKDKGNNGRIANVDIIESESSNKFALQQRPEKNVYHLEVIESLEVASAPDGYDLQVRATDAGTPPRTTEKTIHISLLDKNDHAPEFPMKMYEVFVNETVPVNTPLFFVTAQDADRGQNAEIRYDILSGNDNDWFKMDAETGLLSTSKVLDSETMKVVELQVKAVDQGNIASRKAGNTLVRVNVVDCNDNVPVFDDSVKKVVKIQENQNVGTYVTTVSANDRDSGDNGFVSYSIVNPNEVPFRIDHFSGEVFTTQVLDFESMRRVFRIRLRASDWGEPFRREAETTLVVKLQNVNDNRPQFEKVNCMGYISREAPLGVTIAVMTALDFDVGNDVEYQIVSGNKDNCFKVDSSSGVVKLNCNLKKMAAKELSLFITAFDGVNTAKPTSLNLTLVNNNRNHRLSNDDVSISCQATDATKQLADLLNMVQRNNRKESNKDVDSVSNIYTENRHTPEFVSSVPSDIDVIESTKVGSVVLQVSVHDRDHAYNGLLSYVISSGNQDGCFWIDTLTGDLKVMSPLDRERTDLYKLNITVYDHGHPTKMASKVIVVTILDDNDCKPRFHQSLYKAAVYENVTVGSSIAKVSASDDDLGRNAELSYSLISEMDEFSIDSSTGILSVAAPLDREKRSKHEIQVIAVDDDEVNPLTATAMVEVTLLDINDNAPVFVPSSYRVKIREDHPVNAVVMAVSAHDVDLGSNGVVRYRFQSGDAGMFDIDRQTGIVRLNKHLDYEAQQTYNITVRANDRGVPPLASLSQVVVEIVDVNENLYAPHFQNQYASGNVKENSPIGKSVMQVLAVDEDEGTKDKEIIYSIREGTGLGHFTIDNNGIIRTNEVLDRESTPFYWLTVYAQDRGTVPLYSYIWVYIKVDDVNDNIPQTLEPVYYPSIKENSPMGTSVVQVMAEDKDQLSAQRLTYVITNGDPKGFFTIDITTGLITTSQSPRKLDRESQAEHELVVTISDNGDPEQTSKCSVVVKVTDENDWAPKFQAQVTQVRIPLSFAKTLPSLPLLRVVALDRDEGRNGDIDYSFEGKGSNRFNINPKSGVITATRQLEAKEYDLTVKASDLGQPQRNSTTRVRLRMIDVPSTSPNPPTIASLVQEIIVPEKDEVHSFVGQVEASDDDDDPLWYYIKGGNTKDAFTISPDSGVIFVAKPLDVEKVSFYNITLVVTDGSHDVYTWIHIKIADINDNRPQFNQQVYMAEISENAPEDTSVAQVSATDLDSNSRVYYSIPYASHKESEQLFRINEQTGVIYTRKNLDREDIQQHQLTVMVHDTGLQHLRNFARVIIRVKDHNDYAPQFLSDIFVGQVFETAAIGSSVVNILAIDRDRGQNAEIHFSIISGNVGGAFSMDELLGTIRVAKQLDLTSQSEYNLVVKAVDAGSPPKRSTVRVKIAVTISNNAPPRFTKDEYSGEVFENQPLGTFITGVAAVSRSSVVFEIVNGNEEGYFTVNPNSGVIATAAVLDFEEFRFFNLTVRATNMVNIRSQCHVLLHVMDQNDNRPEFDQSVYEGTIMEGMPTGSIVLDSNGLPLVVHASDNDTDLNAILSYSIIHSSARMYFRIDASTGAIRTKQPLDHETISSYQFAVQVKDQGSPSLTAQVAAIVKIDVLDVNDSPPAFTKMIYRTSILLPTYKDVAVLHMPASDPDTDVETNLVYSITSGNHYKKFMIEESTGILRIVNQNNLADQYKLQVQVSDGKYESGVSVIIDIEDSKNSGLSFTEKRYSAEVMEEKTTVENLVMIQVVGHALNEHLSFSILNPNKMFAIGSTSGVLKTTGIRFDRELQDSYKVVVQVEDGRSPRRTAHVLVDVKVLDKNDNSPVFVNQPYHVLLSVDSGKGDVVKQVSAIDRDIGENGEIFYKILQGDEGKFRINKKSGEITVRQAFEDVDKNKKYTLQIQAQDRGSPAMSNSVYVTIQVLSRKTPVFSRPYYAFSIPENVPLHHTVSSDMAAISPTTAKLIYSITHGDIYDEFSVDFSAGFLKVIDTLDYEMRKHYDLTVRATDTISGAYSEVPVSVDIEDINDRAPSFDSLVYYTQVSESTNVGTNVLEVKATDEDSGANGLVMYSLEAAQTGSNDSEYFYIDQSTGVITVRIALDYELKKKLHFIVRAEDSGNPPLSSVAHIHVNIKDLNDNPPQFTQEKYHCTVSDVATRGQFVAMVSAFDPDDTDALSLMYTMVSGNEEQIFKIDSSQGIIKLSSLRRSILHDSYLLNVSVSDGVYTNFAQVNVKVIPSNHFAPQFEQIAYEIDVTEDTTPGTVIGQFVAHDEDKGYFGTVNYSINNDQLKKIFKMNTATGELSVMAELDRESRDEYEIPIMASDLGGDSGFALIRVKVLDVNDNIPEFRQRDYKANIFYSAEVGTAALKVKALDRDLGNNTRFKYSFSKATQAEVKSLFHLNEDTGDITVSASLKNSTNELFQFFVSTTDIGHLEDNVPVEIYVMGEGDVAPKFQKDQYFYFILENMAPGYIVATLKAKGNGKLHYSIIPGNRPDSNTPTMFKIDNQGNIEILTSLDADKIDMYNFTVRAETMTTPPLAAETEVVIKIMDTNDNAPVFGSDVYLATVNENAAVGTRVTKVSANDDDDGSNADLSYTFAPGSEKDARIFTIDSETGWISTITNLDRETQASYVIHILATDRGAKKLTGSCEVHIDIIDHNDSPPVFSQKSYSGAINEDALPGNIIVTIATSDKDQGSHADVSYYITGGDPLGQFSIQDGGQVFVAKTLDRETTSNYDLEVTATDGAHVGMANINIIILDANDNSPVCAEPLYQVVVKENLSEGSFIMRVAATDADEPTTRNVRIAYSIKGEGSEMFTMHRATGIMTTARILDREEQSEYHLTMVAQDGGGQSCQADIYVSLEDVNDNVPRFTKHVYMVKVAENSSVNTLLTRVSAVDDDLGLNRKIRYQLVTTMGGQFVLDPTSGILSLSKKLDFETHKYYNLTVKASDRGAPQQSSTAHVIVRVLDINDNTPEFERNKYKTKVREGLKPGADVVQVLATSRDSGVNAEITYSIVGGNEREKFGINARSGQISVSSPLDYDQGDRDFFLTIQANTPSLSNTTIVEIQVTDDNDNPPVFAKKVYDNIIVVEDALTGDAVLQLQASDRDSIAISKITYSIVSGDEDGHFDIDSDSGYITVAKFLDRETTPSYTLVVMAMDSGLPKQSASVSVLINVADANDNAPWFDEANYTAVVQENLPVELELMQVKVVDHDLDPNGPPFQYDIIRGNERNEFRIDRDGIISTSFRFNKKIKDTYTLIVRVIDNGTPPMFNDTTVTIHVVEESAFPPEVAPLSLSVNAYLDEFPGGVIGRVRAHDRDPYDKLVYGIVSENTDLFTIDSVNGTITTNSLDSGLYTINVSVTDGRNMVYKDVEVEVNAISEDVLTNAVTVRIASMTPEEFVVKNKGRFVRIIQDNIRSKTVHILSVQPAFDVGSRKRRNVDKDLDVLVAVSKNNDDLYKSKALSRRLVAALKNTKDFRVVKIFHDACTKEFECGDREICKTFYELNKKEMISIETDTGNFVSFRYAVVPKCVCRGDSCLGVVTEDPCSPNPCSVHQVCRAREDMSYQCTCPDGKTGEKCDLDEPDSNCVDHTCVKENRPMTFNGDSYARWRLVTGIERQLRLKLRMRTLQSDAILMYASGVADYSILEITNGRIQYRFDCGSGPAYVLINKKANDGFWHFIEVVREGNEAKVIFDNELSAEATAHGTNDVLNLSSNDVYFGAQFNGYTARNQFRGCLRDVLLDGEKLPYSGANSVAVDQTFTNVEFQCKDSFIPGICSSQPCQNRGICKPGGPQGYTCDCPGRFLGENCEYDTNPCASSPCMHGGICQNLNNNFKCVCKGRFKGKRCDYGLYCEPNPCQNNGVCDEGSNGPVCSCKGFQGTLCEKDVDECEDNPCKYGGKCFNTPGGFTCNCTTGSSGLLCQETDFAEISSNSFNMRTEEIFGIAGVAVGLVLIVVIFVFVRRWRIRKRRAAMQRHNGSDSDMFHKEDFQRNKLSNLETGASANMYPPPSPRPPPVPTRPASYTPSSNHASLSTLNNFDSVRNYGSAAEELDTCHASIYSPEFLSSFHQELPKNPTASVAPSLPPPPPSNSASDTDSIQKPAWEFDYPNLNENYAQGKNAEAASNKLDKILPKELQAACNAGSTSSLPVSESEDDMNASRALSQYKRTNIRSRHAANRSKKPGYHWDTSDWAPNPALPNITEVPTREYPDSPNSSLHSNESNTHIGEGGVTEMYPDSEYLENDSEYVGDSEYAENEFDDDDDEDLDTDFPEPPEFTLTSQEDLSFSDVMQHDYSMHPNKYLPTYSYQSTEQLHGSLSQDGRGNYSGYPQGAYPQGYPQGAYSQAGYPRVPNRFDYNSDAYPTDFEHSAVSGIDECMSVSMAGYTSTNASMSDISGLCEIEDSEVNLSDYDEDETTSNLSAKMSNAHLHTQV